MKILVTNDDGIFSDGLWALVKELKSIGQVMVVAPDREQSAVGTAVTLWQPLRIRKMKPAVPNVEAYSIEGTPSDGVILALGKLAKGQVGLVVSGINQGLNLGEDVYISGTVGGALQGYFHGLPAIAFSTARENSLNLDSAASIAALLAEKLASYSAGILLNVNLPDLPLAGIRGVQIARLADESHINTVEEEDHRKKDYYWLVRRRLEQTGDRRTDIWAVEHGRVSLTPLQSRLSSRALHEVMRGLRTDLLEKLRKN